MKRLEYKQPRDQFVYVVDFNAVLASGESVSWVAPVQTTLYQGRSHDPVNPLPDVNDEGQVVLNALASDGAARILIGNGTPEQIYKLRVLVSTSFGNVYDEDLVLPVAEF